MVAVQCMRLPSASGKAEMPGVGESMRVISSDCKLNRGMSAEVLQGVGR